jgi:hypothetical protein
MRYSEWEKKLEKVFREWSSKDFIWGESDCCIFASDCVEAITGKNLYEQYLREGKKYKTREEADSCMSDYAGALKDCWVNLLGKEKPPLLAKRGDVVLVRLPNGDELAGVVDLSGRYVKAVAEKGGTLNLPLRWGVCSWSV